MPTRARGGAHPAFARLAAAGPIRALGSASYAISLVAAPIAALATARVGPIAGRPAAAASAALFAVGAGIVLWQLVDRWFSDEPLRYDAARAAGPILNRLLAPVRAARLVVGRTDVLALPRSAPLDAGFYAPPPRPMPATLEAFAARTTPDAERAFAEDLIERKHRLAQRSTALLDAATGPAAAGTPPPAPVAEKPGFYRRAPAPAPAGAPIALRLGREPGGDDARG